jgi:hypothetical protein
MKIHTKAIVVILALSGPACEGTAPPTPETLDIKTPDSSSQEAPADVSAFVGTWLYQKATSTNGCLADAGTMELSVVNQTLRASVGTAPNEIIVDDSSCVATASVSGNIASAECGAASGDGLRTSVTYTVSGRTLHKHAITLLSSAKFGSSCLRKEDATLVLE